MQLPFFYEDIPTDIESDFSVSKETSKHLIQVLRKKRGDAVIITNGRGLEVTAELENEDRKKAIVRILEKEIHRLPEKQNAIAIALIKNMSRFEWFLEKATELGVKKIFPLITQRTERNSVREERMQTVMISALIQSRQFFLPEFAAPAKIETALKEMNFNRKFIAHCVDSNDKQELKDVIGSNQSNVVLIGPEGDFTEDEIALCLSDGYRPVSLGKTRLRTETAALKAAVYLS